MSFPLGPAGGWEIHGLDIETYVAQLFDFHL
jgi:hypothetical protein